MMRRRRATITKRMWRMLDGHTIQDLVDFLCGSFLEEHPGYRIVHADVVEREKMGSGDTCYTVDVTGRLK